MKATTVYKSLVIAIGVTGIVVSGVTLSAIWLTCIAVITTVGWLLLQFAKEAITIQKWLERTTKKHGR